MAAFMARDDNGSMYANFCITVNDYDPANSTVGQATNGAYTVRAGEYFDGYYYVVDDLNNFMRIDADSVDAYTVLGNTEKRVVDLAFDYTTGTMYGLTLSYKAWNSETYQQEQTYPELVKIDLTTGALTTVCTLDTAGASPWPLTRTASCTLQAAPLPAPTPYSIRSTPPPALAPS